MNQTSIAPPDAQQRRQPIRRSAWLLASVITCLFVLAGCSLTSSTIEGSGTAQIERYDVADFTAVHVTDDLAVDLTVDPSGPAMVEVSIDDNLHEYLSVEVVDGQLEISTDSDIAPTSDIEVRISGQTITGLEATSDANIEATMPTVSTLDVQVDDDATMSLVVDTDLLVLTGDSDGIATVTGRADRAEISVANNSEALLVGTSIINATVDASSDAIIEFTASEEVVGNADSDAVVRIGGTATIAVETSSDAQVSSLD